MTEFFAPQSDLGNALKECCSKREVSLYTPLPKQPCFLEAGENLFAFRVISSDNSVKAMKLVLGITPLPKEVNDAKEAHVENTSPESCHYSGQNFYRGRVRGIQYLIEESWRASSTFQN